MKVTTTTEASRRACAVRKASLLSQLQEMLPFCRGSIHPFRKPAGRQDTPASRKRHEYYNWERWIDGKRVSTTLRVDQVEHIRAGIAGYQVFTRLTQELAEAMEEEHLAVPAWQDTARTVKKTNGPTKRRLRTPSSTAGRRLAKRVGARLSGR